MSRISLPSFRETWKRRAFWWTLPIMEGIAKVKANPPDAIVLDVMMPEKDGYQVCAELKRDANYSDIPIVLLTAVASHISSTRYSHSDGMSTEADDYLPKPASAADITDSIKGLLGM